jgi:hypothetical protein
MRKFILIATLVLVSATAQAAGSRSLTMASNDEPAAVEPSKPVEAQPAEAPKYVERPPAVDATTEQPNTVQSKTEQSKAEQPTTEPSKPAAGKTADAPKAEKPRRKHESTEARVIYELHRHGIYW